ncbi:MAG: hypothetical protein FJ100_06435 [Deltaproteobacteria bacterium]|nr:hypothetical protein [Deltaproteobacteria bacterium]
MQLRDRPALPRHLLADLGVGNDAVRADDPLVAAGAVLDLVERMAALTGSVQRRSAWLAYAHSLLAELGDACPDDVEVRLLACVARTALCAHQTSAGLAAAEQALVRAVETRDRATEILIRAARLPYLAHKSPVDANRDVRLMDTAWQMLQAAANCTTPRAVWVHAEMLLARVAYHGATGHLAQLRSELAEIGRLPLQRDEGLTFVAYASHASLAQLWLRSHRPDRAAVSLQDAANICEAESAWSETANLRAAQAAVWMLAQDFHAAVSAAQVAVQAARRTTVQNAHLDPWLGMPFDMSQARFAADGVTAMAEAVLAAQDLGDAVAFQVGALAMTAFYLADDRALEALDALSEAREVAKSLHDAGVGPALHGVAEALLAHLGVFKG